MFGLCLVIGCLFWWGGDWGVCTGGAFNISLRGAARHLSRHSSLLLGHPLPTGQDTLLLLLAAAAAAVAGGP